MQTETISRFKKYAFLGSLSEDDFRDQVIRPLLLRLGYQDGRDLCGPTEEGKDAFFAETNKLGFPEYVAVQTKKGPLNMSSKVSSNITVAITQILTALTTSYPLLATRQKVTPNRVLLCASGKINNSAKSHIVTEVRSSNIQFLDADDLIPLIDQRLPELWLGIDADLMPYFRSIKQLVLGSPNSNAAGEQGLLKGAASDDIFVPLQVFRRVFKLRRKGKTVTRTPDIQSLPIVSLAGMKDRRILLLGSAGDGKSTALVRIAYTIADRGITGKDDYRVPILLRATEVVRDKAEDLVAFADYAARLFSNSHKPCFTKADLDAGRVLLLIDSLDELASNEERKFILSLISKAQSQYPLTQVVVGSRPYRFVSELTELGDYTHFTISPINWKQAERIVLAAQRGSIAPPAARDILRRIEKVHGITLNPLLVTVFSAVNEYAKNDIPANITELFKKFTELMLGRWDEQKGLKQQYQAPLKDFLLKQVAYKMHTSRRTSMKREDVEQIIAEHLSNLGYAPDVTVITKELFERSGLFRVFDDTIEFRHHMLQEFFAGRCIPSLESVGTLVLDEWWKRAIVFYFGENPDQIAGLRSVMTSLTATGISAPQLFGAASTLGLALQACYLSTLTEKVEAWKWVVDALVATQGAAIDVYDPEHKRPALMFLSSYFYARDSVALSNLVAQIDSVLTWCKATDQLDDSNKDKRLFWTVTGLVESGEFELAAKLLKQHPLSDPASLAAIHLGCMLGKEIRPLDESQTKHAEKICSELDTHVAPYRKQVLDEWGSELLEIREGKVKAIDGADAGE